MATPLEPAEVRATLDRVCEVTQGAQVVDAHVHPLEVLRRGVVYQENKEHPGVHSADTSRYVPPVARSMKTEIEELSGPEELRAKFFLLMVRRLYAHVGPPVLGAQMALGGIGRSLLLPVASPDPETPDSLEVIAALFGGDRRFSLGYSVPSSVAVEGVAGAVRAAVEAHGVCVIKIHPAVTRIDLATDPGVERVESILEAANAHGLGVVIHAGRSPFVEQSEAVGFGCLGRLANVDWCITEHPVVFAHAGAFGHPIAEVGGPAMEALLDRGDHLMVDTSALDLPVLSAVLARIEPARVVFGSDAQYYAPWEALVRLAFAVDQAAAHPGDALRAITCTNPARLLGKETR